MKTHRQKKIRKLQRARRRQNNSDVLKQNELYEMIDGNKTYYPYGYCLYRHAWLTKGLALTHKCEEKQCSYFENMY